MCLALAPAAHAQQPNAPEHRVLRFDPSNVGTSIGLRRAGLMHGGVNRWLLACDMLATAGFVVYDAHVIVLRALLGVSPHRFDVGPGNQAPAMWVDALQPTLQVGYQAAW